MPNAVYCLDLGRSQLKAINYSGETITVPAGVAEITLDKYEELQQRRGSDTRPDVIMVGSQAFVVGERAQYYGVMSDQRSAARYTWDYFGVAAMSMILRYGIRSQPVTLVVSHPPQDFRWKDNLKNALLGQWTVQVDGSEVTIDVQEVYTEDEPVAILRNSMFNQDGTISVRSPMHPEHGHRALIIDSGGITADIAATDRKGKLIEAMIESRQISINAFIADFEQALIGRYPNLFMETARIDRYELRQAFAKGQFNGGGRVLDVEAESDQLKQSYLNRVRDFVRETSGGVMNYDVVLLGGGGAGLLQHELAQAIGHSNTHFAHDFNTIHEAGVRGMLKQYKFWKANQWI